MRGSLRKAEFESFEFRVLEFRERREGEAISQSRGRA
jgi:hypothetical protein